MANLSVILLELILFFLVYLQSDITTGQSQIGCVRDAPCPANCTCEKEGHEQNLLIICTSMERIPIRLPYLTYDFKLEYSNIPTLHDHSFDNCFKLQTLDLGLSGIQAIESNAFRNLSNLRNLLLNGNFLNFSKESLPPGLFDHLFNLERLFIYDNKWQDYVSYRDDLMVPLHSLKELRMDGLANSVPFGIGFSSLVSLKILVIKGGLTHIGNSTLRAFSSCPLKSFYIEESQLESVEPMAFAFLPNLKTLTFNQNPNVGLLNLSKSWYGLQFTEVYLLEISNNWSPVSLPVNISENFFHNLDKTKIKHLILRNNNILQFSPFFSKYLPYLAILEIEEMLVHAFVGIVIDLPRMNSLTELKINAKTVDNHLQLQPTLVLSGVSNNIHQAVHHGLYKEIQYIHVPTTLEILKVSLDAETVFNGKVPEIVIKGSVVLHTVDFENSNLPFVLYNPFIVQTSVFNIDIYLGSNCILDIKPEVFLSMLEKGKMASLFLTRTCLSYGYSAIYQNPVKYFFHEKFSTLANLDLSYNSLINLPSTIFENLRGLRTLNLGGNYLKQLNFSIQHLSNLSFLGLHRNSISYFDARSLNILESFPKKSQLSLFLVENPLVCSCESLVFLKWLFTTTIRIKRLEETLCTLGEDVVPLTKVKETELERLEMKCRDRTILMWSSISFSTMVITIGLLVFFYRHRWDIKFFCLNLTRHRKLHQQDRKSHEFDAFVAFHQDDIIWVKELLAELEKPDATFAGLQFKLCIHQRNWLAGISIEENIVESIQNSRKTIIVLTRKFVRSGWCDFETQMAKLRSFEEGQDIIIVIMLEPVPAAELTGTLKTLVRRLNYLEWPAVKSEQKLFWNKLRRALKKGGPLLPQCECGRNKIEEC